ncbi:MAG: hypothetical protein IKP73_12790 [Bacteroidales bacterium]|nr:hypothetical protein [Bacteroidales bacterium]
MTTEFENIANKSSVEVDSILSAMRHTKSDDARRFLKVINCIVDYYINKPTENTSICYPIIYLPYSPQWAREVLLKFLIIKLSLYYNNDTRALLAKKTNRNVNLGMGDDTHYKKYIYPCKQYLRKVFSNVTDNFLGESGHKNMIVCAENDIRVPRADKNPFIKEFFGEPDDLFTEKNLIMDFSLDQGAIRSQLKKYRNEKNVLIDNLFLIYTNNDKVKSFESDALSRWNSAYHIGVKNCFVFYFSEKPFRLNSIWNRGKQLSKNYLALTDKDFSQYKHYIVFDESETDYLFNRKNTYEHKYFPDDQLMFKEVLGSLLDTAEYKIQERNKFALCLNSEISTLYKQYLSKEYTDYDEEDFQLSFEWQKGKVESEILPFIQDVVSQYVQNNRVAIVLDKKTDSDVKQALTSLFKSFKSDLVIQYYDYSALKPIKGTGNGIKEECVIVLQYRPHYVKQLYAKYPNSFDPYTVRNGQYICDVLQGFVFADMYLWDKYEYDKLKYQILCSEVRKMMFGRICMPEKPTITKVTGVETDFSDESTSRGLTYVKGVYENGQKFNILDSDYVICEVEGERRMARLNDLKREALLTSITKMQKLDEISAELGSIIEREKTKTDEREKIVRQTFFSLGKISELERDSDVALWKILLKKKIESEGLKQAYDAVMNGLKPNERIQSNQFRRWADLEDKMILPLQKICQRRLFDYLGLLQNSPYLSIMRSKKLSAKRDTRSYNSMITNFLLRTLFSEIDNDLFEEINSSEINDVLQLTNVSELQAIVELLNEKIHLNKIAKIQ